VFDLIKSLPPTLKYEPGTIVAEGNFVIAGRFQASVTSQLVAADIVRLKDGVLVEHWDVIKTRPHKTIKSGQPMFRTRLVGDL
jgi:predicted SnoaL-like aldol condensation-catalyzing enzyme